MLSVVSEGYKIRTLTVDETIHFVVKDLAGPLGLSKQRLRQKFHELDDDEKGVRNMHTPGGQQNVQVVTEPGLINLIISCPKSRQRDTGPWRYRRWVTHKVLPSIHRTGEYRLEINRLTAEVAAITAHVAQLTRRVEVSPFKLLVAQITGVPYANNWKVAGQAVCDIVFRVWNVAKEQNRVEQLTPDACWTFASTAFRDSWTVFIQNNL